MTKTKLLLTNILNLPLVFFVAGVLAIYILVPPVSVQAAVCDPKTNQNCTGRCDTSLDSKGKPKNVLTKQQKDSCACDGTPNLSPSQIDSCEKCKQGSSNCLANNVLVGRIQTIVNFLSAVVGIVLVGAIMFGGIRYAMAGDKAESVTAAKKHISNALVALVVFLITFAFLQWLIPGGVFKP